MTKTQTLNLLKKHQNQRGIQNWKKLPKNQTQNLTTYGIGLTQLRKLAKQIKPNHKLAQQLWNTNNHDAKTIAILIDPPHAITPQQAQQQILQTQPGTLAHTFTACDAPLAKTTFALQLANQWLTNPHPLKQRAAYSLIYELAKNKKNKNLTHTYCQNILKTIQQKIHTQNQETQLAMAAALINIGKRNKKLNQLAIQTTKKIPPIHYQTTTQKKTQTLDIHKHLTNPHLQQKLNQTQNPKPTKKQPNPKPTTKTKSQKSKIT